MLLYTWSGRRTLALRQYDECVRILRAELDAPPDAATEALARAIRSGEIGAVESLPLDAAMVAPQLASAYGRSAARSPALMRPGRPGRQ